MLQGLVAASVLLPHVVVGTAQLSPPRPLPRRPLPVVDRCSGDAVRAAARGASDAVDPRTNDAAGERLRAYRAALLERIGSCLDARLTWTETTTTGPTTWARARSTIDGYFLQLLQEGFLVGPRPENASFVRCDTTTMTNADIDAGRLICQYGVATLAPAEFDVGVVRRDTAGRAPPSDFPLPYDTTSDRQAWSRCWKGVAPPKTPADLTVAYGSVFGCRFGWTTAEPSNARTLGGIAKQLSMFLTLEAEQGRRTTGGEEPTVRCDATTTTNLDVEAGRKVCVVGFTTRIGSPRGFGPGPQRLFRVVVGKNGATSVGEI